MVLANTLSYGSADANRSYALKTMLTAGVVSLMYLRHADTLRDVRRTLDSSGFSERRRAIFTGLLALVDSGRTGLLDTWAVDRAVHRVLAELAVPCVRTGLPPLGVAQLATLMPLFSYIRSTRRRRRPRARITRGRTIDGKTIAPTTLPVAKMLTNALYGAARFPY